MSQNYLHKSFPLYALRAYESIEEVDGFRLVHTHVNTYVLDVLDLEGDYFERRLQMLGVDLPYKLYPINKRYETVAQVAKSTDKVFINSRGTVFSYQPTRFYPIIYDKIRYKERKGTGYSMCWFKNIGGPYKIWDDQDYTHAGFLEYGKAYLIYECCHELKKRTRKKL